MSLSRCAPSVLVLLSACAGSVSNSPPDIAPSSTLSADSLKLPAALEAMRTELARAVVEAVQIKTDFARRHGWAQAAEVELFERVEIFASQEDLWARILELHDLPKDQPLPTKGLAAALEHRQLLALGPTLYAQIAPDYAQATPDAWARLLAHELVHRLHVEILGGNEDAMGPSWFFEGLAVFGSEQGLDAGFEYATAKEALDGARDSQSPLAYRRYVAALRFFTKKTPLPVLVMKAADPEFEAWLLGLDETRAPN